MSTDTKQKKKKKKKKLPNMNFSCPAEVEQNQVVTPCFSSHPVNTYSICPMFFADFTLYIGLQAKNQSAIQDSKHKKAMFCLLGTQGIDALPSGMSAGAVGCEFNVNELTVCIK